MILILLVKKHDVLRRLDIVTKFIQDPFKQACFVHQSKRHTKSKQNDRKGRYQLCIIFGNTLTNQTAYLKDETVFQL